MVMDTAMDRSLVTHVVRGCPGRLRDEPLRSVTQAIPILDRLVPRDQRVSVATVFKNPVKSVTTEILSIPMLATTIA
jgi:hypothetical protein